jgi:hypothetical protein
MVCPCKYQSSTDSARAAAYRHAITTDDRTETDPVTPRPWLQHYPAGVPDEIDVSRYPSLVALLDESFALYRDRVAYMLARRSVPFGDMPTSNVDKSGCRRSSPRRRRRRQ